MSNFDLLWPKANIAAAADDGWLLAYTIDSGKRTGMLMPHPHGPALPDPNRAMRHVIKFAQKGSKLHLAAIKAMQASKVPVDKKGRK
jgi:hypothetical protein